MSQYVVICGFVDDRSDAFIPNIRGIFDTKEDAVALVLQELREDIEDLHGYDDDPVSLSAIEDVYFNDVGEDGRWIWYLQDPEDRDGCPQWSVVTFEGNDRSTSLGGPRK